MEEPFQFIVEASFSSVTFGRVESIYNGSVYVLVVREDDELVCGSLDVNISPQNSLLVQVSLLIMKDGFYRGTVWILMFLKASNCFFYMSV